MFDNLFCNAKYSKRIFKYYQKKFVKNKNQRENIYSAAIKIYFVIRSKLLILKLIYKLFIYYIIIFRYNYYYIFFLL